MGLALPIILSVMLLVSPAAGAGPSFQQNLQAFQETALNRGISASVVATLDGVSPDSSVLENLRDQPEFTVEYSEYRSWFLTDTRIQRGRDLLEKRSRLLAGLTREYGIPPEILLAVWGVESNFGKHQSHHDVIRSLSTLAFADSGRQEYFREQLMAILEILDRNLIPRDRLKGSWAGAMGDPQFMPSSYLHYAVDRDQDGRRDLWNNDADILASVANYLAKNDWVRGTDWGWPAGEAKNGSGDTRVINPEGTERSYVVTVNFDVLKSYNPSNHYALVVGELSDRISRSEGKQ